MPAYAKFLKEILSKKRKVKEKSVVKLTERCSAILQNKLPQKCGDPRSFTIPCFLGSTKFEISLCDSGVSINYMPFSIFKKLDGKIGGIRSIFVSLQLADHTTIIPKGIMEVVLVRVDKFVFLMDFIVVKMEENREVPLILGRPLLATGRRALISGCVLRSSTLPAATNDVVPRNRRYISPAEMQAKRAQGLCYLCDEKYSVGHKCNLPKQMFVLKFESSKANSEEEGNIQHDAELTPEEWTTTEGYSNDRPIQIRLDGGSTHNFIDSASAKMLGCTIIPTKLSYVSLGNNTLEATSGVVQNFQWMLEGTTYMSDLIMFPVGRYDLVLGAQWMKILGPFTMDYSALSYDYRLSSPKAVNIYQDDEAQLFMLQVMIDIPSFDAEDEGLLHALHMPDDAILPQPLSKLLDSYKRVFLEPTTLPPQRGAFDHRIPLQPGTKPVNIRPYRYFSTKMDIIEKLVKEILQQGVMVQNNLLAKHSKCVFGLPSVEYLSHFISAHGVATDPRKIVVVQQWPASVNVKQLGRFLDLAVLTTASVLAFPDYSLPFVVETDASGTGIGAFLMQNNHCIAFISKGLSPRHDALSVYERELLALVFAVTKWSHCLLSQHVIVKTDH
ncbi:uncharacterized protein LOC142178098 [Nicotiana tabacum]|uniref:Uncharacterized protein LOC142178098 n=1 Tax=Nicotiana tabacum TaxID=4097 RepID=A0AC58U226_TOBAC